MRISTRLRIGAAIPIAVVIILASFVVLFSNRAAQETEYHNLAMQLNTAISELDIVTYEFLLHYEERMEQQWHSRYDSAMVILHQAAEKQPEWTESMEASFANLRELFLRVAATHKEEQRLIGGGASQKDIDLAAFAEERLVAQLLVQSHLIVADITVFGQESYAGAVEAQEALRDLTLASMVALAVAVVTTSLLIARSIAVPLDKLAEYAKRVGDGEYTAQVETKGKDEIAAVASTVETMVGRLLTTQEELQLKVSELERAEAEVREHRDHLEQMVQDRTCELQLALERLRQSEQNFRNTLDESPLGIRIDTAEEELLYLNQALVDIYGYSSVEELGAVRAEQRLTPESHVEYVARREKRKRGELGPSDYEVRIVRKHGQVRHLAVHRSEILWDRERQIQTLSEDITERKQAESQRDSALKELHEYSERLEEIVEERTRELRDTQEELVRREKLAVLGQMAGGIAHELRNPLSVINSAIYFLKTSLSDGDETSAEYLDMISAEVHSSEQIISGLLNFARSRPPQREETPVLALVSPVLERHPAPETVRVAIEVPADVPAVVVDPQQMRLALGNLISNAYQAMEEGGDLTIAGRVDDGRVALTVSDTGSGISPENMDKIFEPLFTTKRRGIGLGVAICRSRVRANGGTLEVESRDGEGSAFTITLPSEYEPDA